MTALTYLLRTLPGLLAAMLLFAGDAKAQSVAPCVTAAASGSAAANLSSTRVTAILAPSTVTDRFGRPNRCVGTQQQPRLALEVTKIGNKYIYIISYSGRLGFEDLNFAITPNNNAATQYADLIVLYILSRHPELMFNPSSPALRGSWARSEQPRDSYYCRNRSGFGLTGTPVERYLNHLCFV